MCLVQSYTHIAAYTLQLYNGGAFVHTRDSTHSELWMCCACLWTVHSRTINGPHLPKKRQTYMLRSLFLRPCPTFHRLQYGKRQKAGRGSLAVRQAMESWAGPGNEATCYGHPLHGMYFSQCVPSITQGRWRWLSRACWSWARRSIFLYCICTPTCLLSTGSLCATIEWIYPATTEHSLQIHLLLIFLSMLLQHGHSVQSEHKNFTPGPLTVVVIGLETFLKQ